MKSPKSPKSPKKKDETNSAKAKSSTLEHRDKETIELFSEILDRSCPRE